MLFICVAQTGASTPKITCVHQQRYIQGKQFWLITPTYYLAYSKASFPAELADIGHAHYVNIFFCFELLMGRLTNVHKHLHIASVDMPDKKLSK